MDQPGQNINEGEIKELLEENLEISKENNSLLRGMRRSARWGMVFNFLKWVVIIGSALGIYYYFGQMFGNVFETYHELLSSDRSPISASTTIGLIRVEEGIRNFFHN